MPGVHGIVSRRGPTRSFIGNRRKHLAQQDVLSVACRKLFEAANLAPPPDVGGTNGA
jgi:hypothetical protein